MWKKKVNLHFTRAKLFVNISLLLLIIKEIDRLIIKLYMLLSMC